MSNLITLCHPTPHGLEEQAGWLLRAGFVPHSDPFQCGELWMQHLKFIE